MTHKAPREKNFGFNPARELREQTDEDWILGAISIKGLADEIAGLVIALFAWPNPQNGIYPRTNNIFNHCVIFIKRLFSQFLPIGEIQRGIEDFMDCVTRGFNNEIEKQLNWLIANNILSTETVAWLNEKGYIVNGKVELSDRFTAVRSGTTRNGNSMKAPIDSIYNDGCIPKKLLPASSTMTFDQYHDKTKITQELLNLGQEFKKRITINYARTNKDNFDKYVGDIKYEIFDNYTDPVDGDFVKLLAPDYNFYSTGYQILINETGFKPPVEVKKNDMLKTVKFQTDPRIFIVSNANPKNLYWIGDADNSAWEDYKMLLDEGLVAPFETLSDALFESYKIQAGLVNIDYYNQGWVDKFFSIFK